MGAGVRPPATYDRMAAGNESFQIVTWSPGGFANSLISESLLLPSQSERQRRPPRTGEHRLLSSALEEAVDTLIREHPARCRGARSQAVFDATVGWFLSEERDRLFTFLTLCEHLELDAEWILRGLRAKGLLSAPC